MTFSWADKVAPEPAQPMSLGEEYRAWQRAKSGGNGSSGSMLYSLPTMPEQRTAVQRPSIYEPRQARPLQDYMGKQRDPLDRREDESTEAWRRRVTAVARALPDEEVAARLAAIDQADEQERVTNHDQLRAHLSSRKTGTGIGIFDLSPGQRAAALNARQGVTPAQHLDAWDSAPARPASISDVRQAIQAREMAQRGQQPQRQAIPEGSSGTGWMTR